LPPPYVVIKSAHFIINRKQISDKNSDFKNFTENNLQQTVQTRQVEENLLPITKENENIA
jgi:hypothetical protein